MTSGGVCDVVHYGQTSDKKMKNTRIIEMYGEMLRQLKSRLDQADGVFMEMSQKIVCGMTGERFSAASRAELQELDQKYCTILADVLEGLLAVYHGRIRMFPVPDHAGLIEKMEKRNAQAEELERIVDDLMEEAGLGDRKDNRQSNNIWRSMMADMDFRSEFERKFEEAASFSKRPNILVAGYTGCGKTSLIRTILGGDIVPKSGIDNGKPCRIDFDSYENDSIRLWDSRGLELGEMEEDFREKMREFVSDCQDDINVDEHIHLVWYLIQGNEARVTDCDLALMKNIFTFDNVIAVISKKDITKPVQSTEIRKILMEAGVPEHRIVEVSDAEGGAIGCRELVNLSCKMLPDAYRDAFMAAQSIDREAKAAKVAEKKDRAKEIIAKAVAQAKSGENGGEEAGLVAMLAQLSALYGLRDRSIRQEEAAFVEALLKEHRDEFLCDDDPAKNAGMLTGALGSFMRNNFEAYAIARIKGSPLPDLGFDIELFKQYYSTYKEGMSMKPNILVCGKTGVGKTSLIQAVTHRGVVPDSAIGNGRATTEGFHVYETEIANFIDSEGMNPGEQSVDDYADFILDEMFDRLDSNDTEKMIHNIWYCIDGSGARIQDTDAKIIKTFSDKVLLVVTKSELMRKEQTEAVMKTLLDLIPRERIVLVSAENKTGLSQLISKAQEMSAQAMEGAEEEMAAFQDRWDDYYANKRESWQESVSEDADSYINWAAGRAAAIALVPLPLADVAPLIANEVYMIYKLAGVYGIAVDSTIITMLLGCAGGSIVGKIGASFLPFLKVPIAAGITYGVGKAAKAYFESDMTLDMAELKEKFLAGEREAKKRDWKAVEED